MGLSLEVRLLHLHLRASAVDWLDWAAGAGIHPWVLDYLTQRPDQLWVQPPKTEEPFSTPRAWHMLSDALRSYGDDIVEDTLRLLAGGTVAVLMALVPVTAFLVVVGGAGQPEAGFALAFLLGIAWILGVAGSIIATSRRRVPNRAGEAP